jgi:predicted enzyme related to lactoylglutathione lyase
MRGMHRSRLCAIGIDCQSDNLEAAAAFWSAALGRPVDETEGDYASLEDRGGQPNVFVQRVEHPSRAHLDIETDNIDAEVARLEALGAKRVKQIRTWWVMEAPTGHRFCVVRLQRGPLGDDANQW